MLEPENMCQCFFYHDLDKQDLFSMTMPVPPQRGDTIRARMSEYDEWTKYRIVEAIVDITRTAPISGTKYRFIVEEI